MTSNTEDARIVHSSIPEDCVVVVVVGGVGGVGGGGGEVVSAGDAVVAIGDAAGCKVASEGYSQPFSSNRSVSDAVSLIPSGNWPVSVRKIALKTVP